MELLRDYAAGNSEDAFRTLVDRHLGMVYATVLRQVTDAHLAEEATQAVFIALARKARSISKNTVLVGWLFRAARFAGAKLKRAECRRQRWEQEAAQMEPETATPESAWEQMTPVLNDALVQLPEIDRAAVILRFFESKSIEQVGHSLGTTEAAAKMRLSRAVEKLRQIFRKRGVVLPSAVILGALSTHGAQAAPVGLASSVITSAFLQQTTSSLLNQTTLLLMTWTKQKTAAVAAILIALLLAGGTGAFLLQKRHANSLATSTLPGVQQPKDFVLSTEPEPPDSPEKRRDTIIVRTTDVESVDGDPNNPTVVFYENRGLPATNGANVQIDGGRMIVRRFNGAPPPTGGDPRSGTRRVRRLPPPEVDEAAPSPTGPRVK